MCMGPQINTNGSGSDDMCTWATADTIGQRGSMEDANFPYEHLFGETALETRKSPNVLGLGYFWGVYDGHGGQRIAGEVAENLHTKVLEGARKFVSKIQQAITYGYLNTDNDLKQRLDSTVSQGGGTTVLTALIRDNKLYISWAGDARGIVCGDSTKRLLFETKDHKPDDKDEKKRIEAAGGMVSYICGATRVNACLAVARSIGDWGYAYLPGFSKKKEECIDLEKLTCTKVISSLPNHLNPINIKDIDFFVLACDGLWDVINNEDVCKFVYDSLDTTSPSTVTKERAEEIASALVKRALDQGSSDNITVTIVFIKHGVSPARNPLTQALGLLKQKLLDLAKVLATPT